jgi:WD40 repeat protein
MSVRSSALLFCLLWQASAWGQPPAAKDLHGDPLPKGAIACLGTGRLCAPAPITALALSPDGKVLVSRVANALYAWDTATGALLWTKKEPFWSGEIAAFSPDSQLFAFNELLLNRVRVGAIDHTLDGIAKYVQFAPAGNLVAMGTNKGSLYVGADRTLIVLGKVPPPVSCLAWTSDGKALAVADGNFDVWFWDPSAKKEVGKIAAAAAVVGLEFTADAKNLAVITEKAVEWIAVPSRQKLRVLPHKLDGIAGFHMTPDGQRLSLVQAGSPARFRVLDPTRDEQPPEPVWPPLTVSICAFAADGKTLAVATGSARMQLLQWPSGKSKLSFVGHNQRVDHIAFIPGDKVVTVSQDGDGRLWDATTGKGGESFTAGLGLDLHGAHQCLAGASLFAPDASGALCEVEVLTGKVRRHQLPVEVLEIRDVTPDGELVLLRAWGELLLWDLKASKKRQSFGRTAVTGKSLVSSKGRWVALQHNGKWSLRETATAKEIWQCDESKTEVLGFMPDGERVAVLDRPKAGGEDRSFRILDIETQRFVVGNPRQNFSGPVVFSPDGGWMARQGFDNGHLFIEEPLPGQSSMPLLAAAATPWLNAEGQPTTWFGGLAFSADGRRCAVGRLDSTVLIFDLLALVPDGALVKQPVTPDAREKLWALLAGNDGAEIFGAMLGLTESPEETVTFLKDKLVPVPLLSEERLQQLTADLNSTKFGLREAASAELARSIEAAAPALRKLLANQPTLEQRMRAETLLKILDLEYTKFPSPRLAVERGIQLLERIGSEAARKLLRELAAGNPDARRTILARSALRRLEITNKT